MIDFKDMNMRVLHRYLGFFLAGIMAIYALSGIVLIYRDVDTFKVERTFEKQVEKNLEAHVLGKKIRIRNLTFTDTTSQVYTFKMGSYNPTTGEVVYTKKELPFILSKLTKLHKAKSSQPLYWLNIFFGSSLLFFVVSAFWMFRPKTKHFKDGILISIIGSVLTLILLFV